MVYFFTTMMEVHIQYILNVCKLRNHIWVELYRYHAELMIISHYELLTWTMPMSFRTLSVRWQAHLRDPQTQPKPPKTKLLKKKTRSKVPKTQKTGCAYSEHYTN